MQLGKESLKNFRLAVIRTLISTILVQHPDQLLQ